MNPIRIISNNFARAATITGSSASGFPAQRLATDIKSEFFRSSSNSVTLTCTFAGSRTFNCVSLPETNLSAGATLTVSGVTYTVPALTSGNIDGNPTGASGFALGAGRSATVWLAAPVTASSVSISISNSAPIEAAFLVVGMGLTPTVSTTYTSNFALDAMVSWKAYGTPMETVAGDSLYEPTYVRKVLALGMERLDETAKSQIFSMFKFNNAAAPVFVSAFPENLVPEREEEYTIYGRLEQESALKMMFCERFTTDLKVTSL